MLVTCRVTGLEGVRSDEATWALEYLYDEKGTVTGGIYSAEGTSAAFLVVATDRGDVRELLDADGRSFAFYSYDAYGNPDERLSRETTKVPAALAAQIAERNVLRYAGYCYDEMSGLYYLSQRYYDPATASFISKDPARADGEESAYQYCAGDPVGSVDPSGMHSSSSLKYDVTKGWYGPYIYEGWKNGKKWKVKITFRARFIRRACAACHQGDTDFKTLGLTPFRVEWSMRVEVKKSSPKGGFYIQARGRKVPNGDFGKRGSSLSLAQARWRSTANTDTKRYSGSKEWKSYRLREVWFRVRKNKSASWSTLGSTGKATIN